MKKIKLFLVAGVVLLATLQMTSCKKDVDSSKDVDYSAKLAGTWNQISEREIITDLSGKVLEDSTWPKYRLSITFKGKVFDITKIGDDICDTCATYEANKNNIYLTFSDGEKVTMYYELSDNKLTFEYPKDTFVSGGITYLEIYSEIYIKQ
jgi:hypothetical protein